MRVKPIGKGLKFTVVLSVWTVLSTLIIALRMSARYSIHKLGMDDYLMLGAWIIFVFVIVCDFLSINSGIGARAYRLTENDIVEAKKWFFFSGIGYSITTALIKTSICVLLLRIMCNTKRVLAWCVYGVVFLAWVATFVRVVGYTTRCKPFSAAWQSNGTCRSPIILADVTWFFSSMCIATDWACAIIPLFVVWHLNLKLRAKIQVALILTMGLVATVATIIRMKHLVDYTRTHDVLYNLEDVSLWSDTEACLGMIAGSLPAMKPLLRYIPCCKAYVTETPTADAVYRINDTTPRNGSVPKQPNPKTMSYLCRRESTARDVTQDVEPGLEVPLGDDKINIQEGNWSETRLYVSRFAGFESTAEIHEECEKVASRDSWERDERHIVTLHESA